MGITSATLGAVVFGVIAGRTRARRIEREKYETLVKAVFEKLDSIINDDNISSSELAQALPYTTEVLFLVSDENDDGLLSFEEFKATIYNVELANQIWVRIK